MQGNVIWRFPVYRGEQSPHAKLTDAQVLELRKLASEGTPRGALATRFGITISLVGKIVRGEAWRHLLPGGRS